MLFPLRVSEIRPKLHYISNIVALRKWAVAFCTLASLGHPPPIKRRKTGAVKYFAELAPDLHIRGPFTSLPSLPSTRVKGKDRCGQSIVGHDHVNEATIAI